MHIRCNIIPIIAEELVGTPKIVYKPSGSNQCLRNRLQSSHKLNWRPRDPDLSCQGPTHHFAALILQKGNHPTPSQSSAGWWKPGELIPKQFHHSMVLGVQPKWSCDPVLWWFAHSHSLHILSIQWVSRAPLCSAHSTCSPCSIPHARGPLCQTLCSEDVQGNLPLPLMPKLHCLLMYGHSAWLEWWGSDGILPSFITGILSLAYYCNVSPGQQPAGMELQESLGCFINS